MQVYWSSFGGISLEFEIIDLNRTKDAKR